MVEGWYAWVRAFAVCATVTLCAAACSPPSYASADTSPSTTSPTADSSKPTNIGLDTPARDVNASPSRHDDLVVLRRDYVQASPAFSPDARARALAWLDALERRVDTMTPEQYLLALLRVAAFADNGHDVLDGGTDAWFPAARLPMRLLWLADGWVIARAAPEYADLVGARVLTIEGREHAAMLAAIRPLWGGEDAARRWNAQWVVECAGLLHALGIARSADALDLVVRTADGRRIARRVPFVPYYALPPGAAPHRVWGPEPWPREADLGWRNAAPSPAPLAFADGERHFRAVPLPALDAVYLQLRAHRDVGTDRISDAMRATDELIATRRPANLIVDLRFDTGGNIDLTREWQTSLPHEVRGTTYVLIGPYTFSAGLVAAAALKHDGGDRVRIVGEAPGDRLAFWSEGRSVCLPHSRYCMRVNDGLWDLERGCTGRAGCYGDRFAATVGDLRVDIVAPLTTAAWLAGRDPGMDAVQRELGSRGSVPANLAR
jgi:hypothetical protein